MYPHRDHRLTDSLWKLICQVPLQAHYVGIWKPNAFSTVPLALWTILNYERKVGLVAIETVVGDTKKLSNQVHEFLRNDSDSTPVLTVQNRLYFENTDEPVPPIETTIKPFLDSLTEQAVTEAALSGVDYVGSEHLLLAIISTADANLTSILSHHKLTHEAAVKAIGDLLAS